MGAVLFAAACRSSGQSAAQHLHVTIDGLSFSPATLLVQAGDTVTWINKDLVPHTATGPNGAWTSGLLAAGATFTAVITEAGTGTYRCDYHPMMTAELLLAK